eukprot:7062610-Heterocapsa_arctica.AAC.1
MMGAKLSLAYDMTSRTWRPIPAGQGSKVPALTISVYLCQDDLNCAYFLAAWCDHLWLWIRKLHLSA